MKLDNASVLVFSKWLVSCGAEILKPTSQWEVLRVRAKGETLVAHRNAAGRQTWPNALSELYKLRSCGHQPQLGRPVKLLRGNRRGRVHELGERSGWRCWYCDAALAEDTATVEEICPRQIGGPVHIGNQCLACAECNKTVGNLPVVDKVRYRDEKRNRFLEAAE